MEFIKKISREDIQKIIFLKPEDLEKLSYVELILYYELLNELKEWYENS